MSELTVTAVNFNFQPVVDLPDGAAILRWAYTRPFLTNDNIQVQWGTATSGFGIETPCSIASGLITVDQDTLLWTTDDAQDPSPLSIGVSAWLLNARGKIIQQLQIAGKTQWVVPSSLAPTCAWAQFSNYNQAVSLYYYNPNFYNAPETDRQIRLFSETNYASDTHLGGVYTSVSPAIESQPVAWITDDPLVRDAIKIQSVAVSDTTPLDTQTLVYNQATNQYEPSNQNPGTGNVISNEVSSVDGEGVVFSGTGGHTIRRLTGSGLVLATSGVLAPQTATQATALLDPMVGDSGSGGTKGLAPAPAAGDAAAGKFLKADGTYAVPSGSGISQLTGDVTAGPGSGSQAATLANTAVTPGSYTNTNLTVDSKGRITTAANGTAGGYSTVQDEGTPLTQRSTMNFTGAGVTAADAGGITVVTIPGGSGSGAVQGIVQGRLTTESGVPISTTDRTAQSTIYFTPYGGNQVALYNGATWALSTFTERSLALSGLTSGKNYDVFLFDNAGTLTLELSAAWTNDTTRADALALQDGVWVKSGATTRLYLGTIRTTGTTTTADSAGGSTTQVGGQRFVWNLYNQVARQLAVIDTTDSWSYTTATWRQVQAVAGNKVEAVFGQISSAVNISVIGNVQVANNGSAAVHTGNAVGVDSTTTPSGFFVEGYSNNANAINIALRGEYKAPVAIGYHFYAWLERGCNTGTSLFIGDNGGNAQAGLTMMMWC